MFDSMSYIAFNVLAKFFRAYQASDPRKSEPKKGNEREFKGLYMLNALKV